jgi:hypothetical protein
MIIFYLINVYFYLAHLVNNIPIEIITTEIIFFKGRKFKHMIDQTDITKN